jgi:prolyl-tRNA synthetase
MPRRRLPPAPRSDSCPEGALNFTRRRRVMGVRRGVPAVPLRSWATRSETCCRPLSALLVDRFPAVTRLSQTFLPTLKDPPSDAEAVSHKLMVRAGLIRQLGAGLWTYLPAGRRVVRKVEAILREEMEAIGCQEMLMPVLQPAEPWKQTGRYGIDELFKLEDRKGAPMVLAMTHEECVTYHVAREVRSYRDLPLMLFHLQTKERDEPRPRAGVLRTREFTMKDAYSFDRDEEGLARSYELQSGAYERIFDRCGLRWYRVESDVGMMGGSGAHEYMAPCPAGENEVALAPGYAANVEVASGEARAVELPAALSAPELVATPGQTTITEVSAGLGLPAGALIKSLPVVVEGRGMVLVLVRGDHRLNEIKLRNALGADFRQASIEEIEAEVGPVGFVGPVGAKLPVIKDAAIKGDSFVTGANEPDAHLRGVVPGRDFEFEELDVRTVEAGDTAPGGGTIEIEPAIEIGNIFKLGTRYSEPLGATYLDEGGAERPIVMGSYGIGPARIVAAAIEQGADERGIVWPAGLAPWQVQLVSLAKAGEPEREAADSLYQALREGGAEVLYDDRDAGPGEKLTDAELLGCPLRVVVGRRGLAKGVVEASERAGGAEHELPVDEAGERALALLQGEDA